MKRFSSFAPVNGVPPGLPETLSEFYSGYVAGFWDYQFRRRYRLTPIGPDYSGPVFIPRQGNDWASGYNSGWLSAQNQN